MAKRSSTLSQGRHIARKKEQFVTYNITLRIVAEELMNYERKRGTAHMPRTERAANGETEFIILSRCSLP